MTRQLIAYDVFSTHTGDRVLVCTVNGYREAKRWRDRLWTLPDGSRTRYTVVEAGR